LLQDFVVLLFANIKTTFSFFNFMGPYGALAARCAMVGLNPPLATYGGYHCAQKQEMSIYRPLQDTDSGRCIYSLRESVRFNFPVNAL